MGIRGREAGTHTVTCLLGHIVQPLSSSFLFVLPIAHSSSTPFSSHRQRILFSKAKTSHSSFKDALVSLTPQTHPLHPSLHSIHHAQKLLCALPVSMCL